ncbi:MAG: hypothetical protein JWN98_550 [Abditibacteriota bacterium]|nr:hypothetical protein [Abditibacteriota bacterium]
MMSRRFLSPQLLSQRVSAQHKGPHSLLKTTLLVSAGLAALPSASQAQTRVQVNGNVLPLTVAPLQRSGRTLVPMRPIFQALGANVNWNQLTQEITAQHGASNVRLQIGRRDALVNNQRVILDQPPLLYRGATMVPLRFVAEGLGADVHWNNALQLVSISTQGTAGQPGQATGGNNLVIPADTVVPVRLNESLSSGDARVGDIFTARVQSQRAGDSEFPAGSNIDGVITAVKRRRGAKPGVRDV